MWFRWQEVTTTAAFCWFFHLWFTPVVCLGGRWSRKVLLNGKLPANQETQDFDRTIWLKCYYDKRYTCKIHLIVLSSAILTKMASSLEESFLPFVKVVVVTKYNCSSACTSYKFCEWQTPQWPYPALSHAQRWGIQELSIWIKIPNMNTPSMVMLHSQLRQWVRDMLSVMFSICKNSSDNLHIMLVLLQFCMSFST